MAETPAKQSGSKTQATTAKEQAAPDPVLLTPILLKRGKKRKKRKKRYTRGSKQAQRFLFGLSRAGYRATNSLAEGMNTFVKRSRKSQRKRRDGLIRDAFRNASVGFADGVSELGKAPNEIARRVSGRRVWRASRLLINTRFFN